MMFDNSPSLPQGNRPVSNDLKDALPKVVFNKDDYKNSDADNKDKLECIICMSQFNNGDNLTLL